MERFILFRKNIFYTLHIFYSSEIAKIFSLITLELITARLLQGLPAAAALHIVSIVKFL